MCRPRLFCCSNFIADEKTVRKVGVACRRCRVRSASNSNFVYNAQNKIQYSIHMLGQNQKLLPCNMNYRYIYLVILMYWSYIFQTNFFLAEYFVWTMTISYNRKNEINFKQTLTSANFILDTNWLRPLIKKWRSFILSTNQLIFWMDWCFYEQKIEKSDCWCQ